MPVDYLQIQHQIQTYSSHSQLREQELNAHREHAARLLHEYAARSMDLAELVARAKVFNANLRCAIPGGERLDGAYPLPPLPPQMTLLAADGSQVIPNRQRQVEFCVINVGAVTMRIGSGQPPTITVQSTLLDPNEMYTADGMITEGTVALRRDLEERRELVQLAQQAPAPVVSLTDGPLELFREPKPSSEYDRDFQKYMEVLKELAQTGAATAGYVDRPRGDLAVRLLELTILHAHGELDQAGKLRPLLGLTDAGLFRETLKEPGTRSAVFAIQSISAQQFAGDLALHFFYLNVGRPETPNLARVEIPAWVAGNPSLLNAVHASLVAQCQILVNKPFPYIIHRAHEEAVISYEDSNRLEEMIVLELRRQGVTVEGISSKQFHKDGAGRTSMANRSKKR